MKVGKKKAAPPPRETATPFFARFLEGQDADDADAKVTERRGGASYTEKQGARKSTSRKTMSAAPASKLQTLKYPSDGDEHVFYPYKVEAATVKGAAARQTLKYPSDRDEVEAYVPVYVDAADAPKTAKGRAKKDAQVRLTTKAADIDESAS